MLGTISITKRPGNIYEKWKSMIWYAMIFYAVVWYDIIWYDMTYTIEISHLYDNTMSIARLLLLWKYMKIKANKHKKETHCHIKFLMTCEFSGSVMMSWHGNVDFPNKGPVMMSFNVFCVASLNSCWTSSEVAGDLRETQWLMWRHCYISIVSF